MPGPCAISSFFQHKKIPGLHALVLNLKSGKHGNNVRQMRAGQRLCQFLLDKLDDLLKIQDKPESLQRGQIRYILFMAARTRNMQPKPATNPLKSKAEDKMKNLGDSPESCRVETRGEYSLRLCLKLH